MQIKNTISRCNVYLANSLLFFFDVCDWWLRQIWGRIRESFRRSLTCISQLCSFKTPARTDGSTLTETKRTAHHSQASDFSNTEVEAAQIQRLLAHWRQVRDRRAPLLHEGDVAIHPCPPLRLTAHVVQSCYLLIRHVPRAELLGWMDTEQSEIYIATDTPILWSPSFLVLSKSVIHIAQHVPFWRSHASKVHHLTFSDRYEYCAQTLVRAGAQVSHNYYKNYISYCRTSLNDLHI